MRTEGLQDERGCRSPERAIHQIGHELALGFALGQTGRIHVTPVALVPSDEAFVRHDLHQFQRRRVAGFP